MSDHENDSNDDMIQDEEEVIQPYQEKEHVIDLNLILKTSFDQELLIPMTEEQKSEQLLSLKTIHLEYLNIREIDNLDLFTHLQVLFLQYNKIGQIQNLETLISLKYLSLNHNQITVLSNLKYNKSLGYLDVSDNQIENIIIDQIPESIEIIKIANNPIANNQNTRKQLLCKLKLIDEIDGSKITQSDRFHALNIFPSEMENYQKKMTQRKIKKLHQQIKFEKQQKEQIDNNQEQEQETNEFQSKDDDETNDLITQQAIESLQHQTERLVEKAQASQLEQLIAAKQELMEYQELHEKIRQSLYLNQSSYK